MLDVVAAHDMGVAIHGDLHNHAKVAIADSNEAVVFSANFDAKHGLDSGVEVGFHVTEVPTICEIRRFIEHAISHATTTFVRNPTLAEVDAGPLAARWCKPWGLGSEFAVALTAGDREIFRGAAGSGPVLYEQAAERVRLYGGDSCLECDLSRENVTGLLSKPEDGLSASDRLSGWLRSVRGSGAKGDQPIVARGFCSAILRLTTQNERFPRANRYWGSNLNRIDHSIFAKAFFGDLVPHELAECRPRHRWNNSRQPLASRRG